MSNKPKIKKKAKPTAQEVTVPLKFNIPADIVTRFASNIVIQKLEDVFRISFFETNLEIQLGEIKEKDIPKEVQANCVASIIVTAEKLGSFVNVLQGHYEKHVKDITQNKPVKS